MPNILVVEDELNVRKLVVVNLIKRGYRVLEADNGRQALNDIYNKKPSLIILDIILPDLSGWDILDDLTRDPATSRDFPVLIMTASPLERNVVLKKYPCVVDILIKPFDIDKLISAVSHALSKVENP